MRPLALYACLFLCAQAIAEIKASCAYPSLSSNVLREATDCGTLSDDGLLSLAPEVMEDVSWGAFGLRCAAIFGTASENGWYVISQNGKGRISPFTQDNDCARFSDGLNAGRAQGKVFFYNQALEIVKRTDYTWTSGFRHGQAKVCRGQLHKEMDAHGDHYELSGGACGFIDVKFNEITDIVFPFEATPEPQAP